MSERSSVMIAGAGQLGSRYLQGLAECLNPLRIFVVDPAEESQRLASERWALAGGPDTKHSVSFHNQLDDVSTEMDVAIIATTAQVRPSVVEDTAARAQVGTWILEKVLAQSELGLDRIAAAIGDQPNAWVNTWGRMTPWYRQMRSQDCDGPVRFGVEGGSWGLACNAIHFLDLMAWWTNEQLVLVNADGLDDNWVAGGRPGNLEVSGVLTASYSGGTIGRLCAAPPESGDIVAGRENPTRMWIEREKPVWHVADPCSGTEGVATRPDGRKLRGRIELQSERTAPLVDGLIDTGTCDLTDLETSVKQHRALLHALLVSWRKVAGSDSNAVPIT
tara:strand:+ start:1605 stop:2603 length:999 start_codon:yes stop_codon:yes gene_type:complete